MTEAAPLYTNQARKALEAFITENPELERLESLLAQFNIFEAIGAVRHEVRHSDFLAYLLNPQENHGLGDAFIKGLLQGVLASEDETDTPVTLTEFHAWEMGAATVQREWQRIDIFLRDERHQFSAIIENKIDTGEHDDQLSRYYERVRREFPKDRILALYLTKEGDEPSDEHYLPLGYGVVCEAVENVAECYLSTLNRDVHTLMTHYAQMLRRHIMSDTEIARLCGLIYQKHKAALDLIYEHRPSRIEHLGQYLQAMLQETPGLSVGRLTRGGRYIGFGWLENTDPLYFVFHNLPDGLWLHMEIGAGDSEQRQRLFEFASRHQPPFIVKQRRLTNWCKVFTRQFLTSVDHEASEDQELENKIRDCWEQFMQDDLPPIREVLAEGGWLNQPASSNQQPL